MSSPNVSPLSQAIAGRMEQIHDAEMVNAATNKSLASFYAEACRQWLWRKQNQAGFSDPIPVPPTSWIIIPHVYTEAEKLYDASWPGIPPLVDVAETGPPVAPQFVEPHAAPLPTPGTVVAIGPVLPDGRYAALPADNMPGGYMTAGPGGVVLRKIVRETPWGKAGWYEVIG